MKDLRKQFPNVPLSPREQEELREMQNDFFVRHFLCPFFGITPVEEVIDFDRPVLHQKNNEPQTGSLEPSLKASLL